MAQPTSFAEGKHHSKNHICPKRQMWFFVGGPEEIRTPDPYNANVMRSQLRYRPMGYGCIILPEKTKVKDCHDFFPSLLAKIVL